MSDCITGLQTHGSGRVPARQLDVPGSAAAYVLMRIGDASVFEDCVATGGSQPAVTCASMLGPKEHLRRNSRLLLGARGVHGDRRSCRAPVVTPS